MSDGRDAKDLTHHLVVRSACRINEMLLTATGATN